MCFIETQCFMRKDRDSNPGYPQGYNGFRDRPNRPLWHLSKMGCKSTNFIYYNSDKRNRSASIAAIHPDAAAVTAWRYLVSLISPAAKTPGIFVAVEFC